MLYTIQVLEAQGKIFDYIILLEPTSPLRKKNDIDEMIKLAGDNPESDGVISVGEVQGEHPATLHLSSLTSMPMIFSLEIPILFKHLILLLPIEPKPIIKYFFISYLPPSA